MLRTALSQLLCHLFSTAWLNYRDQTPAVAALACLTKRLQALWFKQGWTAGVLCCAVLCCPVPCHLLGELQTQLQHAIDYTCA